MKKLKKIWKSRAKILEGLWYNHIVFFFNKKHWAFKLVQKRREICASCPMLDEKGTGPEVVIKGKPACGICGCNIKELTASLSSDCSADTPLWKGVSIKKDYEIEALIQTKDIQDDYIHRR